jgi:tetratricopeptide (TPR) repeat protein
VWPKEGSFCIHSLSYTANEAGFSIHAWHGLLFVLFVLASSCLARASFKDQLASLDRTTRCPATPCGTLDDDQHHVCEDALGRNSARTCLQTHRRCVGDKVAVGRRTCAFCIGLSPRDAQPITRQGLLLQSFAIMPAEMSDADRKTFYEMAKAQAEDDYRHNNRDSQALTRWGGALLELANFMPGEEASSMVDEAVDKFQEALVIDPKKHEALWCLGNAYTSQGFLSPSKPLATGLFTKAKV